MKLFSSIFYQYYVFYKRFRQPDPRGFAILAYSFSIAVILISIHVVFSGILFQVYNYQNTFIFYQLLVISVNYYSLGYKRKAREIIKKKPHILDSPILSSIIAILFFIFSIAPLFIVPYLIRYDYI